MDTLIKCSIRRYYGAESVEFGAEIMIDLTDPHQKRAAFTKLYQSIDEVHKHYAAELLPKVPNSKPQQETSSGSDGYVEFECSRLVVETKDGKAYYKVRGGQFTAHGVRVWDEVLAKAGLKDIPIAGLDLTGWTAKAQRKDGKVQRIVSLKKNE